MLTFKSKAKLNAEVFMQRKYFSFFHLICCWRRSFRTSFLLCPFFVNLSREFFFSNLEFLQFAHNIFCKASRNSQHQTTFIQSNDKFIVKNLINLFFFSRLLLAIFAIPSVRAIANSTRPASTKHITIEIHISKNILNVIRSSNSACDPIYFHKFIPCLLMFPFFSLSNAVCSIAGNNHPAMIFIHSLYYYILYAKH